MGVLFMGYHVWFGAFVKLNKSSASILLLLIAVAVFSLRGPLRAPVNSFDFTGPYIATKAWLLGVSPFGLSINPEAVRGLDSALSNVTPAAYPPSSYAVFSPLAALPWEQAKFGWLIVNLIAFGLSLYFLIDLANIKERQSVLLFLAYSLAFNPVHTAFSLGQPAILVFFLGIVCLWLSSKNRFALSGLTLGIALAVKPQLFGLVGVYFLLTKRWSVLVHSGLWLSVLFAIGVFRLDSVSGDWLGRWQQEIGGMGGVNITYEDLGRMGRLYLNVLFLGFIDNARIATMLSFLLIGALTAVSAWSFSMKKDNRLSAYDLTFISLLLVAGLLVVYHNYYDAMLLLLPVSLAFGKLDGCAFPSRLLLVLVAPFLMPIWVGLKYLMENEYLPDSVVENPFWVYGVLNYQVWLIVFIFGILVYAVNNPTANRIRRSEK